MQEIDIRKINMFAYEQCKKIDIAFRECSFFYGSFISSQKESHDNYDLVFKNIRKYLLEDNSLDIEIKKKSIEVSVDYFCAFLYSSTDPHSNAREDFFRACKNYRDNKDKLANVILDNAKKEYSIIVAYLEDYNLDDDLNKNLNVKERDGNEHEEKTDLLLKKKLSL